MHLWFSCVSRRCLVLEGEFAQSYIYTKINIKPLQHHECPRLTRRNSPCSHSQQDAMLYFPTIGGVPRHPAQNPRRYRSPSEHNIPFETHMIKCEDGVTIHSWLLYHPSSVNNKDIPTIIFFHGNAGNIGLRLPNAIHMYLNLQANIWLVEYRGYGDSDDAVVNEKGLKDSILRLFSRLV